MLMAGPAFPPARTEGLNATVVVGGACKPRGPPAAAVAGTAPGAPSAASTGFPAGTAKNISPEVTGSFTPTMAGACVATTVAGTCVCCAGAAAAVCAGGEATTAGGGADTNWLIDVAPVLS